MSSVAIEARGLKKGFRIPAPVGNGRLRFRAPSMRSERLEVLNSIDFEIEPGEFFGIVGRNGSGKTTLLKLMAGIYEPDEGTVRCEGRVVPLVDVSAGFSLDLSARENVIFNAVLMGLSTKEARARVDEVFEFAEFEQSPEQIVSNLSAGTRLRLAFSVMLATRPDVVLLDEVLAVGDAGFRQKCAGALEEIQDRGGAVVLVTHSMAEVERTCTRAMLLNEGRIAEIGDPGEVARRYLDVTAGGQGAFGLEARAWSAADADAADFEGADLVGPDGAHRSSVEPGEPLDLRLTLLARRRIETLGIRVELRSERGARISAESRRGLLPGRDVLGPGERIQLHASLPNPLTPGEYTMRIGVFRNGKGGGEVPLSAARGISFAVGGEPRGRSGLVSLPLEARIEGRDTARPKPRPKAGAGRRSMARLRKWADPR